MEKLKPNRYLFIIKVQHCTGTLLLHRAGSCNLMSFFDISATFFRWQVLQSRNFLRGNKLLGSFKLDVATVWSQPGTRSP